jgi:hypothetical protein
MPADDPADILRRMRLWHEGVLCLDGDDPRPRTVRFVLDPATGEPVLPVEPSVIGAEGVNLFTPDDAFENPDALKIMAQAQEVEPDRSEACDRYLAYFGSTSAPRWARLRVVCVKRLDSVIDGEMVRLANPLRSAEGALCMAANRHAEQIAMACARQTGTSPRSPAVVGVDPWGADVRARFGVIRIEFAHPVSTPDEARGALSDVLGVGLQT